ncbi:hypothetical protein Tco_1254882 [Tanacetum coccineum]
MVPFNEELGYTGSPYGLDSLGASRAQILLGMFQPENVDDVHTVEELMFQPRQQRNKFPTKRTSPTQEYGTLIPEEMINQAIKDSKAYKIYLSNATGAATPKKARKFKKPASPSKKQTLVLEDKPAKKSKHADKFVPAQVDVSSKKPSRKKSGVVIRDTPGVQLSKKKAANES